MTTIYSRKLLLVLAASLGLTAAYALEYEQFVYSVENGEARVAGLTNAGKDAEAAAAMGGYGLDDKVANAFIYAFGDAATNAPLMTISFDDGKPVVTTPSLVRTEGVKVKILSTTDLADWSNPEETEITVQSDGTIVFPRTAAPARFFRLMVVEE